jgi:hypothetical protein
MPLPASQSLQWSSWEYGYENQQGVARTKSDAEERDDGTTVAVASPASEALWLQADAGESEEADEKQ